MAKENRLNWKLILLISGLGLIHGVLSLFGIVHGWEQTIWIFLAILSIIFILLLIKSNYYLHGLFIGIGITALTGTIQALFLDTYLSTNTEYLELLDPKINYRIFIITFIPVFGGVYGSLIGLISLGLKYLLKLINKD